MNEAAFEDIADLVEVGIAGAGLGYVVAEFVGASFTSGVCAIIGAYLVFNLAFLKAQFVFTDFAVATITL